MAGPELLTQDEWRQRELRQRCAEGLHQPATNLVADSRIVSAMCECTLVTYVPQVEA